MSTVQRTLAIILGASDFSKAGLSGGPSFFNSASDLRDYLLSRQGLELAKDDVLYLFDSESEASKQLVEIGDFLERNQSLAKESQVSTLLIYYVGHGGLTPNSELYLVVRSTQKQIPWISSIRVNDLGSILKQFARFQRRYLILDNCFAGQALKSLQSAPSEIIAIMASASMPSRGSAVLCSSGAKDPSLAPPNLQHTMFSDAFLHVLKTGASHMGPMLTLREMKDLVARELRRRHDNDFPMPEVHSPDQSDGDISDISLFPNRGHRLVAERKVLTVMFSDIPFNYTAMNLQLSVEDFSTLLNEHLNAMTEVLYRNLGTLDHYTGGAIKAFWGYPDPQEDHAYRACCCALQMQVRQQQLNRKWKEQGHPEGGTLLGLHSGPVTVASIGSERRTALTAMGGNVDFASRLGGLNTNYRTHILVSEMAYAAVKNTDLVFRELDLIRSKESIDPVVIYNLVCHRSELNSDLQARLDRFAAGRALYQGRKWEEAQRVFQSALEQWPDDGPSQVFCKRSQHYLFDEPPAKWDGVYSAR